MDLNNIKKLSAFEKIPEKTEKTRQSKQSEANENFPDTTNLPKASSELLRAYNGIVSFGKKKTNSLNDSMINAKANEVIGRNFSPEEKAALIELNISNANDILTFYKIIHEDTNIRKNKGKEIDNSASIEKAKSLISNKYTKQEQIQEFLQLTNNGYPIQVAINIIKYEIKLQDREKLKQLSETQFENNRQLSEEEAITCLTYGIDVEKAQNFIEKLEKNYSGNKLNLYEAALCTIHDLNDAQINNFFNLKNEEIDYGEPTKYTLSTQEAILLTKADFSNKKIKQYAKLRTIFLKYEAIRQHEEEAIKIPSAEKIIEAINNEKIFELFENNHTNKTMNPQLANFYKKSILTETEEPTKKQDPKKLSSILKKSKETSEESTNINPLKEIELFLKEIKSSTEDPMKKGIQNVEIEEILLHDSKEFLSKFAELIIKPEKTVALIKNKKIMQIIPYIDQNIFWQSSTGESKKVFDLFKSLLEGQKLTGKPLNNNDIDFQLPDTCTLNNGILTDNQHNFSVNILKAEKNKKPILIIQNQNGQKEEYIAYDGAIVLLKGLKIPNKKYINTIKKDLDSHAHLSNIETEALYTAAKHFVINLFDKNGGCIISKGISSIKEAKPFNCDQKNTNQTKDYYSTILNKLHNNNNEEEVTIENILKLIPKDAMLQIRPYSTSTSESTKDKQYEILYSISAEWKDADGKDWELRIHSHDLKFPEGDKHWIYRLGYRPTNTSETLYYEPTQNDFIKGNKNPATHVRIEKEPQDYKNKLISNSHFQKTIRDISKAFNKTEVIKTVCEKLGINWDKKQIKNIKIAILEKCKENAGHYYKYKQLVDNLLEEQGLPPFDKRI